MAREDLIGLELRCIGTDFGQERTFTVGKIYKLEDGGDRYLDLMGEDGFKWYIDNFDLHTLLTWLSMSTTGTFEFVEMNLVPKKGMV